MPKKERKRGKSLPVRAPEWEPILSLASDHIDDFMWMYSVELTDGTRLQVYKHYWTRNVLHLDNEGRAFVDIGGNRYEEVAPSRLLSRVLRGGSLSEMPASFVGHNYAIGKSELQWTRSATRHRIGRERSCHVIEHCGLWLWRRAVPQPPDFGHRQDRILFFGDDASGEPLEVFATESAEGEILVIHAMALRDRYRGLYEEAKRWRR